MQAALVSYYYWKRADFDALLAGFATKPLLLADSGAFSAKSLGADISLPVYAAWLKKWEHLFTHYANLDVIGDWRATAVNQKALEEAHGLRPMPVFHWGSPLAELDRLVERYPYVALGGIARLPKRSAIPWVAECFKVGRGRAKFHGFGVTGFETMSSFGWESCDSSSWVQPQKFGAVSLFDGKKTTRVRYGRATAAGSAFLRRGKTQALLARNGITSALLLKQATPTEAAYQGMVSMRRLERQLKMRGGPIVYLAISGTAQVDLMKRYEREEESDVSSHQNVPR